MRKKIRFDNPNKLTARHILLDGRSIDIKYIDESPTDYRYHIAWTHSSNYNEILIHKEFDSGGRGIRVDFQNLSKGVSAKRYWKVNDLKDRDKILSKMIGLQKRLL